jgi:sterol desaturase/sphingolipid hydroxylase (fatty acid hydroxylase superfamily)
MPLSLLSCPSGMLVLLPARMMMLDWSHIHLTIWSVVHLIALFVAPLHRLHHSKCVGAPLCVFMLLSGSLGLDISLGTFREKCYN